HSRLRGLRSGGQVEVRRKRSHHGGTLPSVVLADITGRDADGEFLARPTEWDEEAHGAAPVIRPTTPRRRLPSAASAALAVPAPANPPASATEHLSASNAPAMTRRAGASSS